MLFIHHMENLLDRSSNYKDPLFRWKLSQVSSHFQNSPPVENMLILRMENRSGMQRVLKVREKSHLVFFHGLNESLGLCRKLSETEKRCRKILGRLNSFTQQEEQRKKMHTRSLLQQQPCWSPFAVALLLWRNPVDQGWTSSRCLARRSKRKWSRCKKILNH